MELVNVNHHFGERNNFVIHWVVKIAIVFTGIITYYERVYDASSVYIMGDQKKVSF